MPSLRTRKTSSGTRSRVAASRHRNPSSWRAENHHIRSARIGGQLVSEVTPGIAAVVKNASEACLLLYSRYDSRYLATRSGGAANFPTIGFTIFTKSFQPMAMASLWVPALNTISGSAASTASTNTVCP